MTAADLLHGELKRVAQELGADPALDPLIERPRDPAFGDWTTNFAMVLARPLRRPPRDLAQEMVARLDLRRAQMRSADIAGPGFINFRVDDGALNRQLIDIISADVSYGRTNDGQGHPVVVEFVSANPTGPLHVGSGERRSNECVMSSSPYAA
jgi:arginyl-tRNA synthetase